MRRATIALMAVVVATVGGYAVGHWITPGTSSPVSVPPSPSISPAYVVPTGPVASPLPGAEDSPGWDCRAQGFHDCVIAGERWLNLDHLPAEPYMRCLIVWNAMGEDVIGSGITYDAVSICAPLMDKRG